MIKRTAICLLGFIALAGADEPADRVILKVSGPPIDAQQTGQRFLYEKPEEDPRYPGGGAVEQGWSMLGREDRAADTDSEYRAKTCPERDPPVQGTKAVLAQIVEAARSHKVVIINESHTVTQHRDFSRLVIAALRPHRFTTLAAETFGNVDGEPDPVQTYADLTYVDRRIGDYSREPVFGQMLRDAKALGYQFVAYEEVSEPGAPLPDDWRISIRDRETAQAQNLAAILADLPEDQKLIVHVGYSHASEAISIGADGWEDAWMAARLKRDHGIDPMTIGQTICRGGSDTIGLALMPTSDGAVFDLSIDHPVHGFRHGRSDWRFQDGAQAVDIPEPYANASEPLILEAFVDGEPFDAVPVDRVWVEPGEDIKLALKPGRYTVRAVRPVTPPSANPELPTTP